MKQFYKSIVLLGLAVLLSACAGRAPSPPDLNRLNHLPRQVMLDGVLFHAQSEYQCGPAALAMMINHQGVPDTPEDLIDRVYIPQRKGSLQVEMVSAARERDLLVYPLEQKLEAILAELSAGHPVLVMQNLAFEWYPQWHYAVVVGYDLDQKVLYVHSGLNKAQTESFSVFLKTWQRAERWARVILPPGTLPASAQPLAYLKAASDLEQTGRLNSARLAYEAALQKWPDQDAALLGLGNVAWAQDRKQQSADHFRELVRRNPNMKAGWNNLSVVLDDLGCSSAALQARKCGLLLNNGEDSQTNDPCPIPSCR